MTAFLSDPRWGSVAWPIATGVGIYQGSMFVAVFAAFWAGVSIQRWLADMVVAA